MLPLNQIWGSVWAAKPAWGPGALVDVILLPPLPLSSLPPTPSKECSASPSWDNSSTVQFAWPPRGNFLPLNTNLLRPAPHSPFLTKGMGTGTQLSPLPRKHRLDQPVNYPRNHLLFHSGHGVNVHLCECLSTFPCLCKYNIAMIPLRFSFHRVWVLWRGHSRWDHGAPVRAKAASVPIISALQGPP